MMVYPFQGSAKVLWDGVEIVPGQIGKITIKKPINLWKLTDGRLKFSRILNTGEQYRVYGYNYNRQQYRVGGDYYITNMQDYVYYQTPSKRIINLVNDQTQSKYEAEQVVNLIVKVIPQEYDQVEVGKIKERLSKIPTSFLQKLKAKNVVIKLVDAPITNLPEFAHLSNIVPRGWEGTNKTWDDVPGIGGKQTVAIVIGKSDYGLGHGAINLELHETAHTIDQLVYEHLSSTSSFISIWEKEATQLFGDHHYYSQYSEEYFAETFAMFYYGPVSKEKLKSRAPLTYTFFQVLQ
jgi:hypothetical protein